jgi:dolichol-phosphate mannosyltransferase
MNKTANYNLTLIVPVYNEFENFQRIRKELSAYLDRSSEIKTCVLFVDDGSTDGSRQEITKLCSSRNDFFYVLLDGNQGLSTALKAGIDNIFSQYTGYMDADLQTCPDDMDLLLPFLDTYTMVTGIRVIRSDRFVKKLSSKIANSFRRFMTKDGIEDTGCPLKVIRTANAKKIPFFKGMHRFLPALILLQEGGSVKQVPVRHLPRTAGKSKFHVWNRLKGPFIDCFAYRWMKKRYIQVRIDTDNL